MLRRYQNLCLHRPVQAVFLTGLFCLSVQIGVDAYLGDIAEYFNAWYVILTLWAELIGAGQLSLTYIIGQGSIGRWALPVALIILILEPLVYAVLIVTIAKKMFRHQAPKDV